MPLNTVQEYVKGVLNGSQLPMGLGTITAMITPPSPGESVDPVVFVWGSIADEKRQSMPRHKPGLYSTGGFKTIIHKIDLWLIYCAYQDDDNVDSLFPSVIDAVMAILRDTLMPVQNVADPVTGALSDILAIGEDMTWDYAPVHTITDQAMLRFTARLTVDVKEKIQS